MKILLKEIADLQSEFETERQDYLETIRKQERNVKLLSQIAEKMAGALKKECNYRLVKMFVHFLEFLACKAKPKTSDRNGMVLGLEYMVSGLKSVISLYLDRF